MIGVLALTAILAPFLAAVLYKIVVKKYHIWLPGYLMDSSGEDDSNLMPKEVILAFVDHYEPHYGKAKQELARQRVQDWLDRYPVLCDKHQDADGVSPQHTFFYPYDELDLELMRSLSYLAYRGYGEIELHLHHRADTEDSLTQKLNRAKKEFAKVGAIVFAGDPLVQAYSFIHGNWSLDDASAIDKVDNCGVTNELQVLSRTGCYADFTFPAINTSAQPRMINQAYYATDDPKLPKSYDRGVPVQVGQKASGDLLMVPGILTINWSDWRHVFYPAYDDGSINDIFPGDENRIDKWVETGFRIPGRPDWIFIKIFSHGAAEGEREANLGSDADTMYQILETKYNDGERFRLHYVSAREMFNLIKAAEAGKTGNPNQYRDFVYRPPLNRRLHCNRIYDLEHYEENKLSIRMQYPTQAKFLSRLGVFRRLEGNLAAFRYHKVEDQHLVRFEIDSPSVIQIDLALTNPPTNVTGDKFVSYSSI